MTDEQIDNLWRSQPLPVLVLDEAARQALDAAHHRENRRLIWLNIQEVAPAAALAAICGWTAWSSSSTERWAFGFAAVACAGVGLFLLASTIRQRAREQRFGDSVREQLQRSLSQVRHREWLYRNIFWWYLLPLVLGWGAVLGTSIASVRGAPWWIPTIYIVLCLWFFRWVYRANRRIASVEFAPRRRELEEMLQSLDGPAGEEAPVTE